MRWSVGFEHSLKVRRGSSSCCSVGKHHGLVVDASGGAEEQSDMGEFGKVEHQVDCSVLNELQGSDDAGGPRPTARYSSPDRRG